jgi:type IX secretion system PorP/SprF family membrane protein
MRVTGDQQGLYNTLIPELTYSYRVPFNERHGINFGLTTGIINYSFNNNDVITGDMSDPALAEDNYNRTKFSTGFGLMYNYENFEFHATAPRLLKHENFKQELFGMAAYQFVAIEQHERKLLQLKPSVAIHWLPDSPYRYDINLLAKFSELVYVRGSYKSTKSIVNSIGIDLNSLYLGYSYGFNYLGEAGCRKIYT